MVFKMKQNIAQNLLLNFQFSAISRTFKSKRGTKIQHCIKLQYVISTHGLNGLSNPLRYNTKWLYIDELGLL